jgi:hypothetical protein
MRYIHFLLPLMIAAGLAHDASATVSPTNIYSSMNASSCMPTSSAIYTSNLYTVSAGAVSFDATHTGQITLYCPVPVNNDGVSPGQVNLTYTDPDGTGTTYQVKAQLIALNLSTGALSTASNVADSNSASSTTHVVSGTLSGALNFDTNYYYIRVDIIRSSTASAATFYGANLGITIP